MNSNEISINEMDEMIEILPKIRLDLIKEIFESLGINLGKTDNEINYMNYMINDLDQICLNNDYIGNDEEVGDGGFFGGGRRFMHNSGTFLASNSKFIDYNGPKDGTIGSKVFPQGKGKAMDPNGIYWPFYTFGFGASPKKRPEKAKSQRTGIECCKLAVNTIMGYLSKGCKTIGDVICMYHTGTSTYQKFINYYKSIPGIKDIADGRFVSSAEMIQRQNYYQQHLVDYVHMSNSTPVTRSYKILFPLITFISRQEQGVNCEQACRIALQQMGIT